jgi:hypothetical protein
MTGNAELALVLKVLSTSRTSALSARLRAERAEARGCRRSFDWRSSDLLIVEQLGARCDTAAKRGAVLAFDMLLAQRLARDGG